MISTEKLADVLTNYIVKNKAIEEEDYQIYKYGFLTGIEMLICIVSCYGIAIQMGMIKECTMLFLVFFSLRSFVGGIHMDSYKKCFACSCMVRIVNSPLNFNYIFYKSSRKYKSSGR